MTFSLNPGSPIDFQLDFCMNVLSFSYQLHAALVGLALCDVLDIVQRDVKLKLNSFLDLRFKKEFGSPGILFRTQKHVFNSTWKLSFIKHFRELNASWNYLGPNINWPIFSTQE